VHCTIDCWEKAPKAFFNLAPSTKGLQTGSNMFIVATFMIQGKGILNLANIMALKYANENTAYTCADLSK
jgi:hypothetical protein